MAQQQFLNVIDRDVAEQRFHEALTLAPLGTETIALADALGRVLADDVVAAVDVPSFDRSNFDGYAVRGSDTIGAQEETPRELTLLPETIATAVVPTVEIKTGTAVLIATGGMVPRGADAIVMVEHADGEGTTLRVSKASAPGFGIAFAGTDIAAGETVVRHGALLTSRETGVLAAIGIEQVTVYRRPRVAVVSTGDEIIAPGQPMQPGLIFDSNAQVLADAVREIGGEPLRLGIVNDDEPALREMLRQGLAECDVVLLSGGTSKGQGDLCYRVVSELSDPGIVAHGVALKPGKPICLAASAGKPVVILPGFPTSAIFTFHEFVAPVIRRLGGRPTEARATLQARLAVKANSAVGRTEYLLVGLVPDVAEEGALVAFPMGKGSGSVTTFSQADGFVTIDRHHEMIEAGETVEVTLLGREIRPADLVVVGSHCIGLDYLLGRLQEQGFTTKFLAVGSTAGLEAARRGECDLAPIHLMDAATGEYNQPLVDAIPSLELLRGYGRRQGIVYRTGDARFDGRSVEDAFTAIRAAAESEEGSTMVNRNQGSGTRILIDRLLDGTRPLGYAVQAKNHNAVAAAVAQNRADWGLAIERVATAQDLGFTFVQDEQYDFAVPTSRRNRPAVVALTALLAEDEVQQHLAALGFGT